MNTKPASEPPCMVNFLHIGQKDFDYRFGTWQKLQFSKSPSEPRTLYWIGIVDITQMKDLRTPMAYVDNNHELSFDGYFERDNDGAALMDNWPHLYAVDFCVDEIVKAKKEFLPYYHLFLEEIVHEDGEHIVNALHLADGPKGIACKNPWIEEPAKRFVDFTHINIAKPNMIRSQILYHMRYRWQK
jgi:hypothetical protein